MELARLLAPRDQRLLALAHEIYRARPDLQAAFPTPESAGFAQWLGVHGVREDARLAAFYPPLPPDALRATVCGGHELASHLYTGAEDFRMLAELFEIFAQRPIETVGSVLDFGCGCGRALRWFQTALPDAQLFGADVRRVSIDWCQRHLRGRYLANDLAPPLDLPSGSIDLVYALSVFSHLAEPQAKAWLAELARVVKPDGLILVSTHGAFALALCTRSPEHQALLHITPDEAKELLRALPQRHFLHRVLPATIRDAADGVAADYGQAFFTDTYARQAFADSTELVGHVPCGLALFQDMFALRRRR
jgi:SAM-dependent methyltransferase